MGVFSKSVRMDREYEQILECVRQQMRQKALPLVVSGMPPVVENAFITAFAQDFIDTFGCGILVLMPDDQSVIRLTDFLCAQGIDAYRFVQREWNLYNITASHESEHERLFVLVQNSCGTIFGRSDDAGGCAWIYHAARSFGCASLLLWSRRHCGFERTFVFAAGNGICSC